jgi:hypothetical protein
MIAAEASTMAICDAADDLRKRRLLLAQSGPKEWPPWCQLLTQSGLRVTAEDQGFEKEWREL